MIILLIPKSSFASLFSWYSPLNHLNAFAFVSISPALYAFQYIINIFEKSYPCTITCISIIVVKIESVTIFSRFNPETPPLILFAASIHIESIQLSKIRAKAPPSGLVLIDRFFINSLYVANPFFLLPVPTKLLSGDKSASATTNPFAITCSFIVCNKKVFPLP